MFSVTECHPIGVLVAATNVSHKTKFSQAPFTSLGSELLSFEVSGVT